jgi:hypothetical protein
MDTNAIIFLVSTLFTISFFSLWILHKISVVHSSTKLALDSLSDRLDLVENTLVLVQMAYKKTQDIEGEKVAGNAKIK